MKSIIVLSSLVGLITAGMLDGISEKINGFWYIGKCVGVPVKAAIPHYELHADYSIKHHRKQLIWDVYLGKGVLTAQMYDDPKKSDCQQKKPAENVIDKEIMRVGLEYCHKVSSLVLGEDGDKLLVYMGKAYCTFTRNKPRGVDHYEIIRRFEDEIRGLLSGTLGGILRL